MITNNIPTIDLHGESKDIAVILANDFIKDNYQLEQTRIMIIHGIGRGILKKELLKTIQKNKLVKRFYYDFFNIGCLHIELFKKDLTF